MIPIGLLDPERVAHFFTTIVIPMSRLAAMCLQVRGACGGGAARVANSEAQLRACEFLLGQAVRRRRLGASHTCPARTRRAHSLPCLVCNALWPLH